MLVDGGSGGDDLWQCLGLAVLFVEGTLLVVSERDGGLRGYDRGGLLAHLFALEVTLEGVKEQTVMGHRVPVEHLLLLLGADALVLEEQVEERRLGLFEASVLGGLEVAQIAEYTFLKLLHVAYGPAKCFETEQKGADNIGSGDKVAAVPQNARDKVLVG
jgi:hypothetical protein